MTTAPRPRRRVHRPDDPHDLDPNDPLDGPNEGERDKRAVLACDAFAVRLVMVDGRILVGRVRMLDAERGTFVFAAFGEPRARRMTIGRVRTATAVSIARFATLQAIKAAQSAGDFTGKALPRPQRIPAGIHE